MAKDEDMVIEYRASVYNPWLKDFPAFLESARADPKWLMTCLQEKEKILDPNGNVSFALYIYTIKLKCHFATNPEWKKPEVLLEWLRDMETAGHPVCWNDIRHCVKWNYYEEAVFFSWRLWYRWIRTGDYIPYGNVYTCRFIDGVLAFDPAMVY